MAKKKTTISDLISQQMNKQMGDIEFQMAIKPYMMDGAKIDPSIARYRGLPEGAVPDDTKLSVGGYSVPKDYGTSDLSGLRAKQLRPYKYKSADGKTYSFPIERGTVNAVNKNATADVWAHEYRHQEDSDHGGETNNRLMDLMAATNQSEFGKAVDMILNEREYRIQGLLLNTTDPEKQIKYTKEMEKVRAAYRPLTKRNASKEDKEKFKEQIADDFGFVLDSLAGKWTDRKQKAKINAPYWNLMYGDKGYEPRNKKAKKSAKRMDKITAKQQKKMRKSLLDGQKKGRKGVSLLPDGF